MGKPRTATPAAQLAAFMAKYDPAIQRRARAVLAEMRKRLPGAYQLVYDNYNAVVVGFGPSERAWDAVFSIALYPRWVTLFFLNGAKLRDPQKLLRGSGSRVRGIVLDDARDLDRPGVGALMKQALKQSPQPINRATRGRMIIKSISAKQRPRRPR